MSNEIPKPKPPMWQTVCDRDRGLHVYIEGSATCVCKHGPNLENERTK